MAPTNLTAGSRCLRSTQCAPGLVCAGGVCTADLDGFGGTVPVIDAGTPDVPPGMDAPLDDVGPLPDVPGEDAPMTMMDSGEMPDVPPTPVDAPVIMPDTPAVMPDAPPDPPDAPP